MATQLSHPDGIVIILGYKRYLNIYKIIQYVEQSKLDLIVCLDGLALKSSFEDISNRDHFTEKLKSMNVRHYVRSYNMGSKFGIPDFIYKCSFGYKFFVAVEDDLLITRDTLNFFSKHSHLIGSKVHDNFHVGMLSAFSFFQFSNRSDYHYSWSGPSWCWASTYHIFSEFLIWRSCVIDHGSSSEEVISTISPLMSKVPWLSRRFFMNYFEEIILGKRSNWDLSFRFYLLSKSFITLRANSPLVVNCGCDSIAQHHKKKTLVHSNRTNLKSPKLSFCFKNVPAIVIDFFQPWLPKPRIASIILSFLYRCGLGNISLFIHLDTTLP